MTRSLPPTVLTSSFPSLRPFSPLSYLTEVVLRSGQVCFPLPSRTFGNVWRHFGLLQWTWGTGREGCRWNLVSRGHKCYQASRMAQGKRGLVKMPTAPRVRNLAAIDLLRSPVKHGRNENKHLILL